MRGPWLALTLIALWLPACSGANDAGPGGAISPDELASRIESGTAPLILDVRTVEEYRAGHIPGAVNVPHDQLAGRLDELGVASDAEIVVHCQSGRRASMAEEVLRDAGFVDVLELEGHWAGWQAAGFPTE